MYKSAVLVFIIQQVATLNRIWNENKGFPELKWFLSTAAKRFETDYLNNRKPRVIVLGDDIPAEILYAVCDDPFYVIGGSLEAAHWADELTPRDTDPFSRSSLGWLVNPEFDIAKDALIVTAVSSDSRRKLVSVLQSEGRNVVALDVPPSNHSPNAVNYYKEQLVLLAERIAKHTGKRFTGRVLRRAVKKVADARSARQRFLMTAESVIGFLTSEAVLLVSHCMYFADDLEEWSARAMRLCNELECFGRKYVLPYKDKPNVIILGSPVVFPNFKVPQLIALAGMAIAAVADSLSLEASLAAPKARGLVSADSLLTKIAETHLKMSAAGARISNDGLFSFFNYLVKEHEPDGIVCHILKGQIEYDFELPRIEKAAEEMGILAFFGTFIVCAVLLGRVLCGFVCPLGFVQDVAHEARQALHIEGISLNERLYAVLRMVKWVITVPRLTSFFMVLYGLPKCLAIAYIVHLSFRRTSISCRSSDVMC